LLLRASKDHKQRLLCLRHTFPPHFPFDSNDLRCLSDPLLSLNQISQYLPEALVLNIRDPKGDLPKYLAAFPLHACRLNHERSFYVLWIDTQLHRNIQLHAYRIRDPARP
jgi:hypothetical protein